MLHIFANGQDAAPVAQAGDEAVIKSIGNSTTTPRDIHNLQDAKIVFYNLAESVAARLREQGLKGRTIQIGVRDNGLCSYERQMKLPQPTCVSDEICKAAMHLLAESYRFERPLRSIGVRAADLVSANGDVQLSLLEDDQKRGGSKRSIGQWTIFDGGLATILLRELLWPLIRRCGSLTPRVIIQSILLDISRKRTISITPNTNISIISGDDAYLLIESQLFMGGEVFIWKRVKKNYSRSL